MSDNRTPYVATPKATLEEHIVSSCVPKNEREWWAHHEILKQRQRIAELEALYADSCSALNEHMEIHAQVVNLVKELEAEVARVNKAMDPIDQECCDLQAKWKAEAQWAAKDLVNLMLLRSPHHVLKEDADYQHAQRILDGQL